MLKIKIIKKGFYQDVKEFEEEINQFSYSMDIEVKSFQLIYSICRKDEGLYCAITYEKIKESDAGK